MTTSEDTTEMTDNRTSTPSPVAPPECCPACGAAIYTDPLDVLFVPVMPMIIRFQCGSVVEYQDYPPVGTKVTKPCPKSHAALLEYVIKNYENGQNIFRRTSVETLIEEVWTLRDEVARLTQERDDLQIKFDGRELMLDKIGSLVTTPDGPVVAGVMAVVEELEQLRSQKSAKEGMKHGN